MAVLTRVETAADVKPHGSVATVLEQQLVNVLQLAQEAVVGTSRLAVGQVKVGGLARQVL